jgi:hypothetical protein
MNESDTLRHIEQMLDAVPDTTQPSRDEIRMLYRRNRLDGCFPELFANRYEITSV